MHWVKGQVCRSDVKFKGEFQTIFIILHYAVHKLILRVCKFVEFIMVLMQRNQYSEKLTKFTLNKVDDIAGSHISEICRSVISLQYRLFNKFTCVESMHVFFFCYAYVIRNSRILKVSLLCHHPCSLQTVINFENIIFSSSHHYKFWNCLPSITNL